MRPINPYLGASSLRTSRVSSIDVQGKAWDSVVFQQWRTGGQTNWCGWKSGSCEEASASRQLETMANKKAPLRRKGLFYET
jgi:hypothetical protein